MTRKAISDMTPAQLEELILRMKVPVRAELKAAASLLGVSPKTLWLYRNGQLRIPVTVARLAELLATEATVAP